ncbi:MULTISPECIES: spermidine/putrescine ABC transporter substrate-binding protein [Eubacteriales]|uniref:ABC transporter substrate-binding protein n=1 Tax=Eubacteriales TaxID=186802 RepID=UPI000B36FB23|nr:MULTISPECIES: spermidine/putrescine ABC transporter substrate-binding protein [Eubacteriales]MDY4167273.1 spermidine/putrescine ABC transporter substrate-binding protein [Fournierella sp.]OUP24917.1 spermidine/putrescine ABC transporter substrate-binding protein [Gemmiger sp. An194]
MKKAISLLLTLVLAAGSFALPTFAAEDKIQVTEDISVSADYDWTRFKGQGVSLNVYNWGLYISDGSDESVDVISAFEELTGIDINYTTFDTNESMYAKLKSGGAVYDVILPSDYMLGKMANEGMLLPLNKENIPNLAGISELYLDKEYDPGNVYSVPYMWCMVGITYNKDMVDEADLEQGWNLLWDPRYTGQILQFNNSRDCFAMALKTLGRSMNPTSTQDIDDALVKLQEQKPLVQAYVMDEVFDKMEGGEAALAPYYTGDGLTMIAENPSLGMFIPEEGTLQCVDAMCIPASSQNQEAAEMFINYMCEVDVALQNALFVQYTSPVEAVRELLPAELRDSELMYPDPALIERSEYPSVISDELNSAMDMAWSQMKSFDDTGNQWLVPVFLLVAIAMTVFNVWRRRARKKRRQMY